MAVAIDAQGIQELFPEIAEIQDSRLKQGVIDIWLEVAAETAWSDFNEIPKNLGGEKHRSLVGHIRGVTKMALAMVDIAADLHGTRCDRDMLLASCLLHDASKPLESEPNPGGTASGGPPLPGREERDRREDLARRLRGPQGPPDGPPHRADPPDHYSHPREQRSGQ